MTKAKGVQPDPEDFAAVEREYGRLPDDASDAQCAEHYRRRKRPSSFACTGLRRAESN
jgi:hypothetical protein